MLQRRVLLGVAASLLVAAASACNIGKSPEPTPDVNALYTAAAETLVAQFGQQQTQTAQAVTATPQASSTPLASPSPLPTFGLPGFTPFGTLSLGLTPLPTLAGPAALSFPVGCNDAQFIGETVPDKTSFEPEKEFKKAWSLLNVGTCTWDEGFKFSFKSGERLSGLDQKIINEDQFTAPGHSQAFVVHMVAPKNKGEYVGYWQMRTDEGVWFGSLVSVDIIVE